MRTCAAHALRNIHTKETLLFLAALLDGDTMTCATRVLQD